MYGLHLGSGISVSTKDQSERIDARCFARLNYNQVLSANATSTQQDSDMLQAEPFWAGGVSGVIFTNRPGTDKGHCFCEGILVFNPVLVPSYSCLSRVMLMVAFHRQDHFLGNLVAWIDDRASRPPALVYICLRRTQRMVCCL